MEDLGLQEKKRLARERASAWYYKNKQRVAVRGEKYREKNKVKIIASKRKYEERNRERLRLKARAYYVANKERIKKRIADRYYSNRNVILLSERKRRMDNADKVKEQKRRYHDKAKSKPHYVINKWLRVSVLRMAMKSKGATDRAVRFLGCSIDEARAHIESQFKPGMTWANHGRFGWHIDHIRPLSSFDLSNPEQIAMASRWDNLQPLWWNENLQKSDKVG